MENNHLSITRSPHVLRDKTFQFSVRIVRLYRYLVEEKKEFALSKQILRSGTNPGAMVREAINAESGLDFIHKLGIAQKETGETQYWLELLHETKYINELEFQSLLGNSEEIMKILRSSILTKKKNLAIKVSLVILAISSIVHFTL
ncbi:MAG: four helix bundle protein [Saprospiraceae bacterium]